MKGKTWFQIRLSLMGFAFVASLVTSIITPPDELVEISRMPPLVMWITIAFMIGGVLALPLLLQLIFAVQAINPHSDKKWTRPTHESNPFHFGNPLLFFHFGAYVIGAGGLGELLSAPWNGVLALLNGVLAVAGAVSALLGVHLGMRLFSSKMTDDLQAERRLESQTTS